MAGGSDVRKIRADHVRLVTIAIKKYPWQFRKTQSTKLLMEDLPMNEKTPVLVIIYLYDEKSGKLRMIVNMYYI
jgi:hypothetical protein